MNFSRKKVYFLINQQIYKNIRNSLIDNGWKSLAVLLEQFTLTNSNFLNKAPLRINPVRINLCNLINTKIKSYEF